MVALAGRVATLGKHGGVKCTVLVFEPDPACRGGCSKKKITRLMLLLLLPIVNVYAKLIFLLPPDYHLFFSLR